MCVCGYVCVCACMCVCVCAYVRLYVYECACVCVYVCVTERETERERDRERERDLQQGASNSVFDAMEGFVYVDMGWLRLVGSLKTQVSFAKEPYKRDYILQKRRQITIQHIYQADMGWLHSVRSIK